MPSIKQPVAMATNMRRGPGGADHPSDTRISATPRTFTAIEVAISSKAERSKPPIVIIRLGGGDSVGHAARTVVITASQVRACRSGWPSSPMAPAANQAANKPLAAATRYRAPKASPIAGSTMGAAMAVAALVFGGLALT